MKSKRTTYVFVSPRKIYFGMPKAHGIFCRLLHAEIMKGPRTYRARSDYVETGTRTTVMIEMLICPITSEHVAGLLIEYGDKFGLGQFRSGGVGRFTLKRFGEVPKRKEREDQAA